MIDIKPLSFEQLKPIWTNLLWGYEAQASSCMVYGIRDKYDMTIFENPVQYFGAFEGKTLLGVNSGFQTDKDFYRSRGLWVFPEHRNKGVAGLLLKEVLRQASELQIPNVWSFPRKQALPAYLKVGFKQTSDWIWESDGNRFNCYVLHNLTDDR